MSLAELSRLTAEIAWDATISEPEPRDGLLGGKRWQGAAARPGVVLITT